MRENARTRLRGTLIAPSAPREHTEEETTVPDISPHHAPELDRLPDDRATREAARKLRQHVEDMLDHALEESFPASDPPSIALPAGWDGR